MSKIWNYVFLTVGLDLLFNMAGLHTAGSFIIDSMGISNNLSGYTSSAWFLTWITGLALFGLGGILVAAITRIISIETIANASMIAVYGIPLLLFISDWIAISTAVSASSSLAGTIIFIIFAPFVVAYILSIWEWVEGRDM